MDPKQLLAEALRLSDEGRAALIGELIRSLDTDVGEDPEAAWAAKIRSRLERIAPAKAHPQHSMVRTALPHPRGRRS